MANCQGCHKVGCYLVINDAPAMSSVRENCPCRNCLVKMMCTVKCHERIKYYKTLYPKSMIVPITFGDEKEFNSDTL